MRFFLAAPMVDKVKRPQRKKRLIIDHQIPLIREKVLAPIFPNILFKGFRVGIVIGIVLPHDDEFHLIAVARVHKTVAQGRIHPGALNGEVDERIRAIPAKMLKGNAVLGHELDFPVGHLRVALVIRADKRRVGIKIGNSVPAEMMSFAPHIAHVDTDFVLLMAHAFWFGTIIVRSLHFLCKNVAERKRCIFFGCKGHGNAGESLFFGKRKRKTAAQLSVDLDGHRLFGKVGLKADKLPYVWRKAAQKAAVRRIKRTVRALHADKLFLLGNQGKDKPIRALRQQKIAFADNILTGSTRKRQKGTMK